MAILIVLHNSELACEIASSLRRDGRTAKICQSVAGAEFLKEFPQAEVIVTDLVPPVLSFLSVAGENLLRGSKPLIVLASRGHCATFAAMLRPGLGLCIALESGPEFFGNIQAAVRGLLQTTLSSTADPHATAPPLPPKRVAADHGHPNQTLRYARKLLNRQVQFVSDIAHDLRTPLTAICEFAHLMGSGVSGQMTDQQRRYVGIIERRCDEAARMVYDLLDGAKLQSGRIHPHRQAVALRDVLTDVQETLEPAIRHSEVKLSLDVPEGLPRVFADRDMLSRIAANLVSNAIKFSPTQGTVVIRAERHSVSMARVSVIDSGTGISKEDMRRIFHRFEQGPNHVQDGVGLGLSIVRELVKLQGGRVTVESALGKGSRFHFTLPVFLPAAIVSRFFTQLAKNLPPTVSLWSLACSDAAKYDAIHRLLTCTVRSRDLVLPEDDRRRILLVTQAKNPTRLIERLRQQIAAFGAAVPTVCRLTPDDVKRWLGGTPSSVRPRDFLSDSASLAG